MEEKMKVTPKQARALSGLSGKNVASAMGISTNAYRNKENGKVEFTVSEAYNFSRAVGVPFDSIIFLNKMSRENET